MTKWVLWDGHAQCQTCSQLFHSHYLQNMGEDSLNSPSWLICFLPRRIILKENMHRLDCTGWGGNLGLDGLLFNERIINMTKDLLDCFVEAKQGEPPLFEKVAYQYFYKGSSHGHYKISRFWSRFVPEVFNIAVLPSIPASAAAVPAGVGVVEATASSWRESGGHCDGGFEHRWIWRKL